MSTLVALVSRLARTGLLIALLVGVPYGLLSQVGSPLPDHLPDTDRIGRVLVEPASDEMVLQLLGVALWIVWVAFVASVVVEVVAALRGVPSPRLRPIAPMQTFVGWLVAGLLIASPVLAVVVQTASIPRVTATADDRDGLTRVAVTAPEPVYHVARGDWLGHVAERFLGDFNRYPEIQDLNTNQIPHDSGPDGPDHIEPGWQLALPADAHDRGARPHATGQVTSTPSGTPSPEPPSPGPSTPSQPAEPDPDGVVPEPTTPATTAPTTTTAPTREPPAGPQTAPEADTGVEIPGGWLTVPMAAAIVAAAALVWRRRRSRYRHRPIDAGDPTDPDLRPLPPTVARIRNTVRAQAPDLLDPPTPPQPTVTEYAAGDGPDLAEPGPSGPELAGIGEPLPPGGIGLTGPGADPAARALLVAALSSGTPDDPDARGQVIIPADALTTLLGTGAVDLGPIPRLQVTTSLSDALTRTEELLIERRRLLEDHDVADLTGMREANPLHPPMPPVLLLCEPPPPELSARLTTALHLGAPLQVGAVVLGAWPRGDTLTVRSDGRTDGDRRLAVLDTATATELLDVVQEAQTGEPGPAAEAPGADMTTPPSEPQPGPSQTASVRVRLLGEPAIFDRDGVPVTGLRHHARELLVYLAVHRSGANLSDIMEAFWPNATVPRARERLSTETGDLRRRIRQAAGDRSVQPVVNTGSRYHLNPDLLDLDVWHLVDELRRASAATEPDEKIAALRRAIDAHTGVLAEGHDYDWIEQPREQVRRNGIRARLHLAELLGPSNRHAAVQLTQEAVAIDPLNEDVARRAMRALAAVGEVMGVRAQLERLRAALDEIDEEPTAETLALAAEIQSRRGAATHRANRAN
ncbi:BTAD domain-containing putative transcriptional regulator [Virgisporangium ochraceum]|uniref:BTAD domain-containing putative transcriptional regulator n=1 Tax=Virgisporangium ochraceum TaxID=65505 RepID=UPI00194104AA|nr:BTAD domain-containing putative transcriptional regulator [Virgisporangium ochraceum]